MQESRKSEKETLLDTITSLSQDISASWLSIRITSFLAMVACFGYLYVLAQGLTSNFMNLIIVAVLVGNQVFTARTRTKQKKLNEMKKNYEINFGTLPSTK